MASFAFQSQCQASDLNVPTICFIFTPKTTPMLIRTFIPLHLALSLATHSEAHRTNNGFTLGHRQPGDEVIEHREEVARGSPDYALTYARTYVGSNEHLVTQLLVDDLGHGGTAALVAGGPDNTFVTLSFTIMRRGEMHFNVTVYGKLPPYRKVV